MTSYADRLPAAMEQLVTLLRGAGLPADTDRMRMKIPGAWVRPDTVTSYTLAGEGGPARSRVSVLLVAPQEGDAEALADLSRLLAKALTVLSPDEDVDTSVAVPIRNNMHPAFRLTVDLEF